MCEILDEIQATSLEELLYGRKREEGITEGRNYVRSHYRRSSTSGAEDKKRVFGASSSRSVSNSSLKTAVLADWVLVEETQEAIAEDEREGNQDVGSSTDNGQEEEKDGKLGSNADTKSTQETGLSMETETSTLQKLGRNVAVLPPSTVKCSSDEISIENGESEGSLTPDEALKTVNNTFKEDDTGLKANLQHSPGSPPSDTTKSEGDKSAPTVAADQQLKLLTLTSRVAKEKQETSSDKSDMMEYEKLTIEAAAHTREKWKQAEKASE